MAGRTPLACLAILAVLVAAAMFAPVASAGIICTESLSSACGPRMDLYKSGPSFVNQGQSAEYTYQLYNSGAYGISDVVVADDKCSPLSGPEGDDGDGILNVGEWWTYTCEYAPAGDPGDEVENHATADGTALGEVPVHADAYHSTWITNLQVTKTVDLETADPFDELHYTITVTHGGPETVDYEGHLVDEGCEGLASDSENTDGSYFLLQPGQSATYTCHHNFDGEGSYTNEACAYTNVSWNQRETLSIQSQSKGSDITVCDSATTAPAQHTVSGTVFEDMNADGARQDGEPPIAGVVVYADLNGNGVRDEGEPTSTSDGQGNYAVNVPLGTTTIRQETPGGFTCSFPSSCSHTVDLPKNSAPEPPPVLSRAIAGRADDPTGKDFGNWRPASVTGTVIGDDNGNGARDSGELGLAGIAVFADLDGNGTLDQGEPSTTSGAGGTYALTGLKPGGYVVRHVVPAGRNCTAPAGCNHAVALQSGGSAADRDFLDNRAALAVLGARIGAGFARMTAKTGCVTGGGFSARVRGKNMQRIVFLLDGKRVKAVASPRSNRSYSYRVNAAKLTLGGHTIAARVIFRAGSGTRAKTIRLSFQRCAKQLRAPSFTG
jgi:hypothetical protein